jgi:hypothetical protein
MWPRETTARNGDIGGGRIQIATGKANVFGFCSGAPPFVLERRTRSLRLPAQVVAEPTITRI